MWCSTLKKLPSCGCLTSSLTRLLLSYIHYVIVIEIGMFIHEWKFQFLVAQATQICFNICLFRQPKSEPPNTLWTLPPSGSTRMAPSSGSKVQNSMMLTELLQQNPSNWWSSSSAVSLFCRYSARKNYDLYCGMDFRMFPMDTQAPKTFAF